MKGKEEIEYLAEEYADGYSMEEAHASYIAFQDGYTQCQEDMADKKYTEKDMLKAIIYGSSLTPSHAKLYANNYINSLNKQDYYEN